MDELVKALRNNADHYGFVGENGLVHLLTDAADAIEILQRCLDGVCADNDALCKRIDELARICAYHPWPEPQEEGEQ